MIIGSADAASTPWPPATIKVSKASAPREGRQLALSVGQWVSNAALQFGYDIA
jgi:hypothetical protein